MKSKGIRLGAAVIAVQVTVGIAAAGVFDDDLMKLQQDQFDLERQLMKDQFNQQRQFKDTMKFQQQQFKMQSQLQQQQFKLQQQQLRLERQLADLQRSTQGQLRRLESHSRNLSLSFPSPKWYARTPFIDPMSGTRSQMRMPEFNLDTGMGPRFMSRLNDSQPRRYYPFSAGIRSLGVQSQVPTLEQMRLYDSYWANGQYWTNDPYYADLARPAPDLTPENYLRAFGLTVGILGGDWARFALDVAPGLNPWGRFGLQRLSTGGRSFMMNELAKLDPGGNLTTRLDLANRPLQIGEDVGRFVRFWGGLATSFHIRPYEMVSIYRVDLESQVITLTPEQTSIFSVSQTIGLIEQSSGYLVTIEAQKVAGLLFREMTSGPLKSYMRQTGRTLSDSLGSSSSMALSPVGTLGGYGNFGGLNNNFGYSSGRSGGVSQPLYSNVGSYGNNYQIYQVQFTNTFGAYDNRTVFPDFKSINNSQASISDAYKGSGR